MPIGSMGCCRRICSDENLWGAEKRETIGIGMLRTDGMITEKLKKQVTNVRKLLHLGIKYVTIKPIIDGSASVLAAGN